MKAVNCFGIGFGGVTLIAMLINGYENVSPAFVIGTLVMLFGVTIGNYIHGLLNGK